MELKKKWHVTWYPDEYESVLIGISMVFEDSKLGLSAAANPRPLLRRGFVVEDSLMVNW